MQTEIATNDSNASADLASLEARLVARREAISRELGTIPLPAPACDVHFNRLLEERARVVDTLQALRRLRSRSPSTPELVAFLDDARAAAGATEPR